MVNNFINVITSQQHILTDIKHTINDNSITESVQGLPNSC